MEYFQVWIRSPGAAWFCKDGKKNCLGGDGFGSAELSALENIVPRRYEKDHIGVIVLIGEE